MSERLAAETEYAAVGERLAKHNAGIVDEELYREIVSSVNDEIPRLDDFLGIMRIKELMICGHLYVGIDGQHLLLGTFHLRAAYVLGEVNDLTLQVAEVNNIGINNSDMADTGSCQI